MKANRYNAARPGLRIMIDCCIVCMVVQFRKLSGVTFSFYLLTHLAGFGNYYNHRDIGNENLIFDENQSYIYSTSNKKLHSYF